MNESKQIIEKNGVTKVTEVTTTNGKTCSGYPVKNDEVTVNFDEAINTLEKVDRQLEKLSFDDLEMPCFLVQDDWFELGGGKRKPGVWYCYEAESKKNDEPPTQHAVFICSPLYIDAVTNTESQKFYGRLLKFRDTRGIWRCWAMPMEVLRGSCEELRGELLAAGVEIDNRNRQKISDYIQWRIPKKIITAATRTGWTKAGNAFVLHDRVVGDESVHFQSEGSDADESGRRRH